MTGMTSTDRVAKGTAVHSKAFISGHIYTAINFLLTNVSAVSKKLPRAVNFSSMKTTIMSTHRLAFVAPSDTDGRYVRIRDFLGECFTLRISRTRAQLLSRTGVNMQPLM